MIVHLLAIIGLALLCAGWYLVQRFVAKHDPTQPGVEGSCGCGVRKTNHRNGEHPLK